jgi:hypothetical protein
MREGKMRQNLCSRGRLMQQQKQHQKFSTARQQQCNNTKSSNIGQGLIEIINQTFVLDMSEITPSTLDENPCISTGSENRINAKHISPIQEASQWPNTPKRKFRRNAERIHL